jgi:8-oxo-dGTP pyrophosphatase MutT (NUDIX family)
VAEPISAEAVVRQAARALVLDPAGRALLLHWADPLSDYAWWATPGGGIAPDETPQEAARRELFEETGLRDFALGPCVWVRAHEFTWRGRRYHQHDTVYLVRTDEFEPTGAGFQPDEVELYTEHRWWSAGDIQRSRERFGPPALGGLIERLLRDGVPPEPIVI